MKKVLFAAAAVIALLFSSCGGENPSVKLGEELEKSYDYDGKQVELEGYLIPGMLTFISGEKASVTLTTDLDPRKSQVIIPNVSLHFGTGPNSVHFPERFQKEDVEIYDKDGQKYKSIETKVKITGTVVYTAKGPKKESTAMFKVPNTIQKEEKGDGNDYTYTIKDVTITKM